jgi:two-component system, NtrC family, response regulator GlrR
MGPMSESIEKPDLNGRLGAAAPTPLGVPVRSRAAGRRREDHIVGASAATRALLQAATAAARTDLTVLLVGPSGSDKELVARAIHTWGPRADQPFEVLSCAAIPEALQRRELFGCVEDVYPALPGEHAGGLDRCAGGTLVLERIDLLRGDALADLTRALTERSYRREGSASPRPLQTRVICTLDGSSIEAPRFEEVPNHEIRLVPLAERPEDILPLAAHFLAAFSEEAGFPVVGFTPEARTSLLSETWLGDVRELRERIRQAVRLAVGGAVGAEALLLARDGEPVPSFKEAKRAFESRYVESLLRRCGGNISRAARLAKKDRKDFYDVIRRTGVNPESFR